MPMPVLPLLPVGNSNRTIWLMMFSPAFDRYSQQLFTIGAGNFGAIAKRGFYKVLFPFYLDFIVSNKGYEPTDGRKIGEIEKGFQKQYNSQLIKRIKQS